MSEIISTYSIMNAVMFFSAALVLIGICRNSTEFLVKRGVGILMLLFLLAVIRILLPLDIECVYIINSVHILPFMQDISRIRISSHINVRSVLEWMWAIGFLLILYKEISAYITEKKKMQNYTLADAARITEIAKKSLGDKARIMVSNEIRVPMVTGIRKAYINMPQISLTDEETKMILLHEYQHIKDGDILIKIVYSCLKAVFWWNPFVHIFEKELDHLLELRCDMLVTKGMTDKEKLLYLETILKVIKNVRMEDERAHSAAFVNFHTKEITKQRFQMVLGKTKNSGKYRQYVYICIIVLWFIASYLVALQPASMPSVENISGYIDVTPDNAYILKTQEGKLILVVNGKLLGPVSKEELETAPCNMLTIKEAEKL